MSTDRNRELVRRFYEEAVNTGDVDRMEDVVSPDVVEIHDGAVKVIGPGKQWT